MSNFAGMKTVAAFLFVSFVSIGQTIDYENELLWEISRKGSTHKSYLFGTLHSNDRRLFNFSDSTYYALDRAEIIALETDVFSMFDEYDTRREDISLNYDNEGQPYTSSKYSTTTAYGDEDGMPQFLDAYLQQYCFNAGKEFVPLEEVADQLGLLENVAMPDLSQMTLESFLTSRDDMLDLYLKGDIIGMDEMLRLNLRVYPDLYDRMIIDRNREMVNNLDSILQLRSVFCAVGAGHLAGRDGMITLLRKNGYHVRKVLAIYSEENLPYKTKVKEARVYHYVNDTLGVYVDFPGKPQEVSGDMFNYDLKLIYREMGQGNTYVVEIYPRLESIGLRDLANDLIPSPSESPIEKITLDNGGEAYQGIADSYPEGYYWTRVIMSEANYIVIKAYGGNKFMNSKRAFRFFDKVWLD